MWITKDSVYELYNEYKKEKNCAELPNFDLDISYSVGALAMFKLDELLEENYILHINHLISTYEDIFTKSILYHEFTHFYDFINMKDKILRKNIEYFMRTYSEYHASQEEISFQINHIHLKSVNDKVFYKSKEKCDIYDYLTDPLSMAMNEMDKERGAYKNMTELEVETKFHYTEKALFYYLGKLSISHKYFPNDVKNIIPTINPVFSNDMNQIKTILDLSNNIEDTVELLGKCLDSFNRDFILYFKYGEKPIG